MRGRPGTMTAPRGGCGPRCPPASALLLLLLLLLLLPWIGGPAAALPLAAQAAPDSHPPTRGPRTLPPLPPGPPVVEAAALQGAEGGNGSNPGAVLAADDSAGKAAEPGSVGGHTVSPSLQREQPMTQRALTVLMVVSGVVLVYFVVRTVRMRRRNRKTRRYGVLDTNIENMELTPLEQDDEDDDNTLFDANHPRR